MQSGKMCLWRRVTERVFITLLAICASAQGETATVITIGKGSGVVWEGLPFHVNLSGDFDQLGMRLMYGVAAISNSNSRCMKTTTPSLTQVQGHWGIKIAEGVALVPRATVSAVYGHRGKPEVLTGSLGLPSSTATTSNGDTIVSPNSEGYVWCLTPRNAGSSSFYDKDRQVTAEGGGTIVTNGNQKDGTTKLPPMYFASFTEGGVKGDRSQSILPSDIQLRISSLECYVTTDANVDFGYVERNVEPGAELAKQVKTMVTNCTQNSNMINANVNVQFRALSGLFDGDKNKLSLNQGGGYITGEIDNAVTGSGACNTNNGISFDSTPFKVGHITSGESSSSHSNQITWRLCSGGETLPMGTVRASTEMMVTFN
ncbi:hypothetical protein ACQKDS_02520 [Serratia sp. NPDC078593]|uniref:hypothetical protein n=1 Tax=unclassified Serratia (in: enterobacteria) TaxID=2647522 RepID=UPI0037D2250A